MAASKRQRVRAAVRKASQRQTAKVLAAAASTPHARADEVALGVRTTAALIADLVQPGALWWVAPIQYVSEQMSVRLCSAHSLEAEERDDVAAYVMAGLQEFVHGLATDFDVEHFRAWTAAAERQVIPDG